MTIREQNKAEKKRRILEAAERLFTSRGFEQTTVRDIAREAGVGLGTVYVYAQDKHGLLDMMSRDDLARVEREAFADIPPGPLLDRILHVFDHIYAHHARNKPLASVIVRELSFAKDRHQAERAGRFQQFMVRLGGILAAEQKAGRLKADAEIIDTALQIFALHFSYLIFWLSDQMTLDDVRRFFGHGVGLMLDGLRPAPLPHSTQGERHD